MAVLAAFGTGCSMRHASSLTVPLELRTTQVPNAAISLPQGQGRVFVAAVQDGRTVKDRIGENREGSPPIPILADSSPTEFVRNAVIEQFRNDGLSVVETGDAADSIVTMTLTRFWAEESPNYDAQVVLGVEVRSKTGSVLWSGNASGSDGTFGRSLSVENYQQVFSNALVNAVSSLVAKPQFQQALTVQAQQRPRRTR